jgi:hypothetical protein
MLKCLRRQGYPWESRHANDSTGPLVTARAAAGGHVETFAWARENGCAYNLASSIWFAVAGGHIEMIEYLMHIRMRPVSESDVAIPAIAVKHGRLHVLEWMWKQPLFVSNKEFRERAIEFACEAACDAVIDHGLFDAYNWLLEAGCEQELTKERDRQTLAREYIHVYYGQYHGQGDVKTKADCKELTAVMREAERKGYFFVHSLSDVYYEEPHPFPMYGPSAFWSLWSTGAGISWQARMDPPPKPWNLSTVVGAFSWFDSIRNVF